MCCMQCTVNQDVPYLYTREHSDPLIAVLAHYLLLLLCEWSVWGLHSQSLAKKLP